MEGKQRWGQVDEHGKKSRMEKNVAQYFPGMYDSVTVTALLYLASGACCSSIVWMLYTSVIQTVAADLCSWGGHCTFVHLSISQFTNLQVLLEHTARLSRWHLSHEPLTCAECSVWNLMHFNVYAGMDIGSTRRGVQTKKITRMATLCMSLSASCQKLTDIVHFVTTHQKSASVVNVTDSVFS